MKLKSREKKLALATMVLVVLWVGMQGFQWFSNQRDERTKQIKILKKIIKTKQEKLVAGKDAKKLLSSLRDTSLPSDPEQAAAQYQAWLRDLVHRAKILNPTITPASRVQEVSLKKTGKGPGKTVFRRLGFSLTGKATLEQLTQLMFEFYSNDLLHQFRSVSITPIKDSKLLDITLRIEALAMPGAHDELPISGPQTKQLAWNQLDAYLRVLVGRNLFTPYNHPPKLTDISDKKVSQWNRLSFSTSATDDNENDKLTFRLEKGAPEGARMSSKGRFEWTPTSPGQFPVSVRVTDNGSNGGRPASDAKKFIITVEHYNRPPEFADIDTVNVQPGTEVSFDVRAKDEDTGDELTYSLGDEAPEGARIDRKTGSFQWTPEDFGTYLVSIRVTDNGSPPQIALGSFSIVVKRPDPKFDDAKYTFLTAIVQGVEGNLEVWLTIRTTGETKKLRVGDEFSIGSLQGKVTHIEERKIELIANGKRTQRDLGESLVKNEASSARKKEEER